MVKKDSKKSQSLFQYQNSSQQTTNSSQFMPQHFNFQSCKSVLLKIYKVQFRHQNVQLATIHVQTWAKIEGGLLLEGGFYWRKYGRFLTVTPMDYGYFTLKFEWFDPGSRNFVGWLTMMRSRLTLKVKVKGHVHKVNKYGNPGACIDSHWIVQGIV